MFDVAIIGGGPGGYVAAIRAAQLGLKTALIEREELGGVCLNWGCIPTKALLKSAEIYYSLKKADVFGIEIESVSLNFEKMIARSRDVSRQLTQGIGGLMRKHKVTVFKATAHFKNASTLELSTGEKVEAKHIVIATGARPRLLPGIPTGHPRVWTSKEALVPPFQPKTLLVIGSGAIGIEFANFYNMLGTKVTVIELQDRILPQEDAEISALALKDFKKQGIEFHLSSSVAGMTPKEDCVEVKLSNATTQNVDAVLVAVGVVGNTDGLNLENIGVQTDKNHVVINEWCQTSQKGIYAIGDVAGPPWLAHKASHEAILCIEKIAGLPEVHPMKRSLIPGCTYTYPQIASVGLTEEKAKAQGYVLKIGRFPFRGNGKALAMGGPDGLIKTIFEEKTGEILGVHMIGADVTELIHSFVLAKTSELTEREIMNTIFPHPTLSEMLHESTLDAFGRALHI